MSRALFESLNIRGFTNTDLANLALDNAPTNAMPPQVVLEDGSLAFNQTTGHLVKWDATGGAWVPLPGTDGYTIVDNGFWVKKVDLSGPYVYDGTTMKLASHV